MTRVVRQGRQGRQGRQVRVVPVVRQVRAAEADQIPTSRRCWLTIGRASSNLGPSDQLLS
jgi:hypothetical protein